MVELAWIIFSALLVAGVIYTWKFVEYNKKYELQKFDSIDAIMDWLRAHGYIGDDGQPIKCPYCGGTHLMKKDVYYEEIWGSMYPVEYTIICDECKKGICDYAYGAYINY